MRTTCSEGVPRTAGWVALALLLLPLFAGCLSSGTDAGARLPEAPDQMEGRYRFIPEPRSPGDPMEVQFLLQREDGTGRLHLWLNETPYGDRTPSFSGTLSFGGGGEVRSAEIRCSRDCFEPSRARVIPDARDAPAFFGLGPFLGTHLEAGEVQTVRVWDSRANLTINWTASAASPHQDRACVWLEAPRPNTPKTFLAFAPLWGRLKACSGLPVPAEIVVDGARLTLLDLETNGNGPDPVADESPPSVPPPTTCWTRLPRNDQHTLTIPRYLEWARDEDDGMKAWFRAHPQGGSFPGYGRVFDGGDGSDPVFSSGRYVSVTVPLYDPETGELTARRGGKQVGSGALQGSDEQMRPSEARVDAPFRGRGAASGVCHQGNRSLVDVADRLVDKMDVQPGRIEIYQAPDLGAAWQGSSHVNRPLTWLSNSPSIVSPSGGVNIYLILVPEGDGAQIALNGAADPHTGWIRWYETVSSSSAG